MGRWANEEFMPLFTIHGKDKKSTMRLLAAHALHCYNSDLQDTTKAHIIATILASSPSRDKIENEAETWELMWQYLQAARVANNIQRQQPHWQDFQRTVRAFHIPPRKRDDTVEPNDDRNQGLTPEQIRDGKVFKLVYSHLQKNNTAAAAKATNAVPLPQLNQEMLQNLRNLFPGRTQDLQVDEMLRIQQGDALPVAPDATVVSILADRAKQTKAEDIWGWNAANLHTLFKKPIMHEGITLNPARGLASLITDIYKGNIPLAAVQLLKDTRGVVLGKSATNTNQVRPISIGSYISQLAGTVLIKLLGKELPDTLHPLEFGFGKQGGAEILVHATRAIRRTRPEICIIAIDAKNAFGTMPRAQILSETASRFPKLYPFAADILSTPSKTIFTDPTTGNQVEIMLEEGTAQGHPLSPVLFSIALDPILKETKESHPDVIIPHYLDDAYIIGELAHVTAAFRTLESKLPRGFALNKAKTVLLPGTGVPEDASRASATSLGISMATNGIKVVGSPVGSADFETTTVRETAQGIMQSIQRLMAATTLKAAASLKQQAHRVLRMCFSSQLTHLLRTVSPEYTTAAAQDVDRAVAQAFSGLIDLPAPNPHSTHLAEKTVYERILLSTRLGGVGHQKLQEIAPAAYAGSLALCASSLTLFHPFISQDGLTQTIEALGYSHTRSQLIEQLGGTGRITPDLLPPTDTVIKTPQTGVQSGVSKALAATRSDVILGSIPAIEKGTMGYDPTLANMRFVHLNARSAGGATATAFIHANPKLPTFRMSDNEYTDGLRNLLAVNLYPRQQARLSSLTGSRTRTGPTLLPITDIRHPMAACPCSGDVGCHLRVQDTDTPILHPQKCKGGTGPRTIRHTIINQTVYRFLLRKKSHLGHQVDKEPSLERYYKTREDRRNQANTVSRRADTLLYLGSKAVFLDYTVASPTLSLQDQTVAHFVAQDAHQRKNREHDERFLPANDAHFRPIAMDTVGTSTVSSIDFFRTLSHHIAGSKESPEYANLLSDIISTVSVAFVKGNSTVLRRYGNHLDSMAEGLEKQLRGVTPDAPGLTVQV